MAQTPTSPRRAARLCLPALALAALGCGKGTAELSGTVRYNGQVLTRGTVTAFCADGQIFAGLIGHDGRYHIPNLPPGSVRLAVTTHPPIPPGFQLSQQLPPSKDAPRLGGSHAAGGSLRGGRYVPVPERYGNPEQSGLSCAVAAGSQVYDIELRPCRRAGLSRRSP